MRHPLLQAAGIVERILRPSVRPPAPLSALRNFLVLQHSLALGTAVHGTPLIRALREAIPDSRVVLAGSGFGYQTHRFHPLLERVVETPNPIHNLWGAIAALRRVDLFRDESFAVLTPNGSQRTLVALQAFLAVRAARIGFTEAPELYRAVLHYDPTLSQIENNLRLVPLLSHPLPKSAGEPEVFFTESDKTRASSLLQQHGIDLERPVVVFVTQTSPTQQKGWSVDRFREIARWMRARWHVQVVLVGTAQEADAIDELRGGLSFATANLAGATNLTTLCALLSLCDVGLTLDTGTLHLGRAVGLPMVILAPAWSPVREWLPIDNPRFMVLKKGTLPSQPANYRIDEVSVSDVQAAMERLLDRFPPLTRQGRRGLVHVPS